MTHAPTEQEYRAAEAENYVRDCLLIFGQLPEPTIIATTVAKLLKLPWPIDDEVREC